MSLPDFETFVLIVLASLRLSYFIAKEDAPFGIMATLRERYPLGGLTSCMYCVSVWVAPSVVLLWQVAPMAVWLIAVMGAVALLFRWSGLDYEVM